MIPYKQLSLADIFSDCQEKFENDKPAFLSLLETHIDIDEIIPVSFRNHFYASTDSPVLAAFPKLWLHDSSQHLVQDFFHRPKLSVGQAGETFRQKLGGGAPAPLREIRRLSE